MAGIRKKANPSGRFQAYYWDMNGKRVFFLGTHDRRETRRMAEDLEDSAVQIKLGYREPPKSASKHKTKPFAEIKDEYLAWGRAQGGRGGRPWAKRHGIYKNSHLKWWEKRLSLEVMGDLNDILPRVEAGLRELLAKGLTGKSVMNYAEAMKSFCLWCERRGYLDHDPLKGLERFDTTQKIIYRALTRLELQKLFSVVPEERQLLYAVALTTGLRRSELRALRVSDLNIDMRALNLRAEITKNRKPGIQPLPLWLFERLRESVQGKGRDERLLKTISHQTERFHMDAETAGIATFKPGEGIATFHSLRVTFATLLMEEQADLKTAMTLMRHSTPDLTMNRYAKSRRERLVALTEAVGEVARTGMEQEEKCATAVQMKTTDNASGEKIKEFMVGGTGLENVRATEQKLLNSDTSLAQNSTESNTRASNETTQNDKTPPTSEQEKTLFCTQSVLQLCTINSLQLTPELELIIKTWPDLSDETRETIISIISKKEEKK